MKKISACIIFMMTLACNHVTLTSDSKNRLTSAERIALLQAKNFIKMNKKFKNDAKKRFPTSKNVTAPITRRFKDITGLSLSDQRHMVLDINTATHTTSIYYQYTKQGTVLERRQIKQNNLYDDKNYDADNSASDTETVTRHQKNSSRINQKRSGKQTQKTSPTDVTHNFSPDYNQTNKEAFKK